MTIINDGLIIEPQDKVRIITAAIQSRKTISFNYIDEGENIPYSRTVEPFTLGIHKDTRNMVLSAYQIAGHSKSNRQPPWRLYLVDGIENIIITDETPFPNRQFYNPQDKRMLTIICTA